MDDEPRPTTDPSGDPSAEPVVDPVLARIQPRWNADRTERNLKATLDRLGPLEREEGKPAPRLLRPFRRLRRRHAH